MTFNFYQYNVPSGGGQSTAASRALSNAQDPGVILNPLGTIRLPLPNSMVDHQDVVYAVEDLGMVAGAALSKFQQSGSWKDAAIAGAKGIGTQSTVNIGNAGPGGSAGGGNILLQTQGLAVNPFLSVMFKSPAFKKHAFKWLLSPVNEPETIDLNTIINSFRYNQLPAATSAFAGALLAYPNIVQVTVSGSSPPDQVDRAFSYTFKPAVIESFAVNFTPGGQPSFFGSTGGPTQAEITMSLLEIEYWLQNDYSGNPTARGVATAANVENELNAFKDSILKAVTGDNNGGSTPFDGPFNPFTGP
jgi:hypothetical protein